MKVLRTVLSLTFLLAAGCSGDPGAVRVIDSPAGDGALAPRWSAPPGNAPLLSWLEPAGDGHALRYARLLDDGFSTPVTVVTGEDWFVNWADTPSVVLLPGDGMAAHWLAKSGPEPYSYDVRIGISRDGGATWRGYFNPHDDGTLTEHGFARLFPEAGALGAVWLDGRRTAEDGPMTLRYGRFGPHGAILDSAELDNRVCDCCMTGVARSGRGLLVVYRDRSEEEIRDISRILRTEDGWSEPARVASDDWLMPACPVNGPAVAADGESAAVAWFTAAGNRPRVRVAFSGDGGQTFGEPVTVDDSSPAGRVDIVAARGGGYWVSWLDAETEPGAVRLRRFADGQPSSPAATVAEVGTGRASGFPVMTATENGLLFAWTDPDRGTIRVARYTDTD